MEEATIAKIASEALKPVSSVIDALLGPKLQRIRNWAEKRELQNRLGSRLIDVLLDEYLRRLLRRICGITTIVFLEQILPLTSIYEPLLVIERYGAREGGLPSALNVNTLKIGHSYLIVDSAGMGKSTLAKHLVLETLHSTTRIPVFLELRRIGDTESLLEKLATEFDKSKTDVDENVLLMLLEAGNFTIVLDGYDEIPSQYRSSIGQQITELAVRCDKNCLILTSRPEVPLPELSNSKVFEINALNRTQAESLVLRYDAIANIDVGRRLIAQYDSIPERFLETPLLIVLLYRTYGFNQSIATRVSSFYDEVFNALYKGHDLSKAGFARPKSSQLDGQDFRRLLRGFSFLLSVRQRDNLKTETEALRFVEEAITLTGIKPQSPASFLEDLLLAVPLLIKDGTDYRFVHKSMREFFTAEFLAHDSNGEQIIEGIRDGHLYASFIASFEYLSDIDPKLFQRLIVAPLAKRVLSQRKRIKNPYIHSIRFVMEARLAIWPHEKYVAKSGDVDIPSPRGFAVWYFYGKIKRKEYVVTVATRRSQSIPASAWDAITIPVSDLRNISHDDYNFGTLEGVIPTEQWIAIDDDRVIKSADEPAIAGIFQMVLGNPSITVEASARHRREVRVLSETSCQSILDEIRQENQTQNWVNKLISDKSARTSRITSKRKRATDLNA
jgi:hypothetical protein